MSDLVLTERAGAVLVATMNRPQRRNALSPSMMAALTEVLKGAEADPEVRAVVLAGAGPVFCAGLDLREFAAGADFRGLRWFYRESIATPVVAAVQGAALGGGFELVLACDVVVAAEGTRLGIPEVTRGLFAAGGGTTLSWRIPMVYALEMGLTGEPVTAERAAAMGLVNRVLPADQVFDEAMRLAQRIAGNGPLGVAVTKKMMRERRWADPAEIDAVFESEDAKEGARAFAERRPPVWKGR
ncbi:MAG: enoyl-CoA hydratase/isomerase family protein [Frankia sp.]|nr:enoyl-CoA hydratase/isomerase family protein [Frankia sp.]